MCKEHFSKSCWLENAAATFGNLFAIGLNSRRVFHNAFVLTNLQLKSQRFTFNQGIDSCACNVIDRLKEEHVRISTLFKKFTLPVTPEYGSFLLVKCTVPCRQL